MKNIFILTAFIAISAFSMPQMAQAEMHGNHEHKMEHCEKCEKCKKCEGCETCPKCKGEEGECTCKDCPCAKEGHKCEKCKHNKDKETIADDTQMKAGSAIHVKVNGLVCDFCARAVEKVFNKRDEVVGTTVDMNKGLVILNIADGQSLDDATIEKLITDSGYDFVGVTRSDTE